MHPALAVHEAFQRGDLDELKRLLGSPPDFPNCRGMQGAGEIILEYAIYWSPLPFIRALLELGANPNYEDHVGFPSLIAVLSTHRTDKHEIIELLLSSGASVHQRGVNDHTPLHCAAALDDSTAIALLLSYGANPQARTNIDDYETPLELAQRVGNREAARTLRDWAPR